MHASPNKNTDYYKKGTGEGAGSVKLAQHKKEFTSSYQSEIDKLTLMNQVLNGLQSHNTQNVQAPVQNAIDTFLPLTNKKAFQPTLLPSFHPLH